MKTKNNFKTHKKPVTNKFRAGKPKVCKEKSKRSENPAENELEILKEHGFSARFPKAVIAEAKGVYSRVYGKEKRTDYCELPTVTIDGEDSRDLDDAVSLVETKGGYTLYVHIADVSEFVRAGSPLDKEALSRATSVYFPKSVFPMLPKELSNDICSLNPKEKRLALSVKIELDSDGKVLSHEISESVIVSDFRMTYNEVSEILAGNNALISKYKTVAPMLNSMKELRDKLVKERKARGAIDFAAHEAKIIFDENGGVRDVILYPHAISNSIIEEFMILANRVVAEEFSRLKLPFVFRIHEKPEETKLSKFSQFVKVKGIAFKESEATPQAFQKILLQVAGTPIESIVSKVMLRSMSKAIYGTVCSGHFGLAIKYYCHFTSPIRRYPDLMIHRIIKLKLRGKLNSDTINRLKIATNVAATRSSEREREAETAERDAVCCYKAEYMSKHIGDQFPAVISGVTSFGVFAELQNTCEGLIRFDGLPRDNYVLDENTYTMKGGKHSFTLGQSVKIEVISASALDGKVGFRLVE